jgi:hypothetical protein
LNMKPSWVTNVSPSDGIQFWVDDVLIHRVMNENRRLKSYALLI